MEEVDVLPKGSLHRVVVGKIAAMWAIQEFGAPETTDEETWTKYLTQHYKSVLEEYNTKVQDKKEAKAAAKQAKKGQKVDTPYPKPQEEPVIAEKGGKPMPPLDLYKGGAFPEHGLSKQELLLSMLSKNQEERQIMLEMLSQQNDD